MRKLQDWAEWSRRGLIDVLTGMSFGRGVATAEADTTSMLGALTDDTLLYTASYAPFADLPPDLLVDQVAAIREAGGQGEAVFAYNQLTDDQAAALGAGPFREPAVTAHAEPAAAVATGARDLAERVRGVHAPCLDRRLGRELARDLDRAARSADRAAGDLPEPALLRALDRAERDLARAADALTGRPGEVEDGLAAALLAELDQYAALLRYARTH